jgi:two-component system chemotaxis response regulator CheB
MSTAVADASPAAAAGTGPLRVMVVDDAVVVRGLVARWIEAEPDMRLVASLRTGREAVDQLERTNPDVVVLDVEMPDLDGISALPLLLQKKRDLIVIMASTLTRRNAEVSLKALSLGAADYIPKPETNRGVTTSTTFRRDLIDKIRQLGARKARRSGESAARPAAAPQAGVRPKIEVTHPSLYPAGFKLRPFPAAAPRVLLIGSSTGGPQALTGMIARLGPVIDRAPVLITQHMPPTFTTILAEHLARASVRPAREGVDGEPVLPGHVYLAPGGRHMRVARRGGAVVIALDDGPLINFCKPAVDPLFASAAEVWGGAVLALVLTGMGSDGARGAADLVQAGGGVIAQDEATSVVWGMPGAAAQKGVCSAVLPLDQIAPKVVRLFAGDRT